MNSSPATESTANWHVEAVEAVFARLQTTPAGLSGAEVKLRLPHYGPNRLRPPNRRSPWMRCLVQFHNVPIYVLLLAALVTALLGHWVDAWVIFGVVLVNANIGFVQEGKAERALEAIRSILSQQAAVLREGHRQLLPAEALVPGGTWCSCSPETRCRQTCACSESRIYASKTRP